MATAHVLPNFHTCCTKHRWHDSTEPAPLNKASTAVTSHTLAVGTAIAALGQDLITDSSSFLRALRRRHVAVDENHEIEVRHSFRYTTKLFTCYSVRWEDTSIPSTELNATCTHHRGRRRPTMGRTEQQSRSAVGDAVMHHPTSYPSATGGSWGEMSISSPGGEIRVVRYHMYDGGNRHATIHSPRRCQVSLLASGHGCLSPPRLVHTPWRRFGSAGEGVGCCGSASQSSSGWSASRSWDKEAIHTCRVCQHADEDSDERHSDL